MKYIKDNLEKINVSISDDVVLVAVSKTKPIADLQEAYDAGQRVFGENKIQEMVAKHEALPKDIQWHMIGHLQSNKVKYMAPACPCAPAPRSLSCDVLSRACRRLFYGVMISCGSRACSTSVLDPAPGASPSVEPSRNLPAALFPLFH